ncbi:TonB-dependent receptor [Novosphingobium profundi]|uniref:TonB-dependent receptor n=1 Tax=Novosphingobium profundi TaxID=1774954 RepID=UPI001BD9DFE2|nr:TonB-dependent receptor [Novosphingobium profundi]MBT0670503.1 TonB-dependent receptor [Novosphingobium profundi]
MLKHCSGASIGALAIAIVSPAMAQQAPAQPQTQTQRQGGVSEIVVTATRRTENLQDVPVSVNALDSRELDRLNVNTFDDYLKQLPNVTAGGGGPGQNTIYIRGLASTTPNLTVAGVSGLAPNVSMYLDEQPLAQPGRNLDVYAADLQRIEVLSGPQGTLFGASSQAGVVRMITNKPDLSGFDASAKAGAAFTKKGDPSYNGEFMINLPVSSNFGLRAVVYVDDQGGYIDNVHGSVTAQDSARFRSAGTVRQNGTVVSADRAGFQAGQDLSGVNFMAADNQALVQDDFNGTTYKGFRLSALWEVTPDWTINLSHTRQNVDSDGVFYADPELGLEDPSIQRYSPDRLEDDFSNTAWTVEGRLGMLDVVYNGAYTDRVTDQTVDYTDYLYVGQYLPYYICDGSVSYPGSAAPSGTCQAPNLYVRTHSRTKEITQELRLSTPSENRLRATGGAFWSKTVLKERGDFMYPGSQYVDLWGQTGFPANGNFPGAWSSTDEAMPAGGIFRNDVKRTDEQFGLFGQVDYDVVPDLLSASFGMRYYDVSVDLTGTANSSFCNAGGTDVNAFGTNLSDLYDGDGEYTFVGTCGDALGTTFTKGQSVEDIMGAGLTEAQATQVFNALSAPDKARDKGVIFKGTVSLTPADGVMFYATYSEGFRPGLLNRPGGATSSSGYTVPFALQSDTVKNYEIGWKTELFERQLRFNASAFYLDIQNLQTTIFDPSITNLTFSDNAADARSYGIEGDFTFAPYAVPGLTLAGAFSFLDSKVTKVLTPTDTVKKGSSLAYAPPFQGNLRARYEWDLADGIVAHVMPQVTHSAHKYTDIVTINRLRLEGYTTVSLAAGIEKDNWNVEIYGENLTDKRAQVSGNFYFDRARVVINRPLTVGVRMGWHY